MKINIRKLMIVMTLYFCYIPSVFAVLDISGTYSGNISGSDSACPSAGPFTGSLQLTLTGNTAGAFTGSGNFNDGNGSKSLVIPAGGNDDTSFTFSFDSGDGAINAAAAAGTISSGTLSISITGLNTVTTCTFNASGTLSKSSTVVSKDTPSSTITDAILFNTQMQSIIGGLSSHIGAALSGFFSFGPKFGENYFKFEGTTGLNAGDESQIPYGVWGNYSFTDFENDLSSTAFKGASHSFLGGIDFALWDTTIIGVALGYDNSDIDTTFNSGNQNTNSFTVAPYFGALLNDTLSVDFNTGYTYVQYDQFRTASDVKVTSTPSADRWFSAFNLNSITFIDNWIIGGRIGALYASSIINNYTESNGTFVNASRTKVGTASIATDLAYSLKEWEPFLNLSYQYDFSLKEISAASGPQPANDKDDILLSMGVRYFEKSGITGNLEYSKRLLREDFSEDRISLTVRIDY